MNLSFIKSKRIQNETEVYLEALKLGIKSMWLVDTIPMRFVDRFLSEVKCEGFKSAVIMGQVFVWWKLAERGRFPIVYSIDEKCTVRNRELGKGQFFINLCLIFHQK